MGFEPLKCRRCDLIIIKRLEDFPLLGFSERTLDKTYPEWHLTCYAIGNFDDMYWHDPLEIGEDEHNAIICAMCAAGI